MLFLHLPHRTGQFSSPNYIASGAFSLKKGFCKVFLIKTGYISGQEILANTKAEELPFNPL